MKVTVSKLLGGLVFAGALFSRTADAWIQQISAGQALTCTFEQRPGEGHIDCWGHRADQGGVDSRFNNLPGDPWPHNPSGVAVGAFGRVCAEVDAEDDVNPHREISCFGDDSVAHVGIADGETVSSLTVGATNTCMIRSVSGVDRVACYEPWGTEIETPDFGAAAPLVVQVGGHVDLDTWETTEQVCVLAATNRGASNESTALVCWQPVWTWNDALQTFGYSTQPLFTRVLTTDGLDLAGHLSVSATQSCVVVGSSNGSAVQCYDRAGTAQTLPDEYAISTANLTLAVSTGIDHSCAIREWLEPDALTGDLVQKNAAGCWGSNGSGQSAVPANLPGLNYLAVGAAHSCVATGDRMWCFGDDTFGQIDVPLTVNRIGGRWNAVSGPTGNGWRIVGVADAFTANPDEPGLPVMSTFMPSDADGNLIADDNGLNNEQILSGRFYGYTGGRYEDADALHAGKGYWVKTRGGSDETGIYRQVQGQPHVAPVTIPVTNGWNLLANPLPIQITRNAIVGNNGVELGAAAYVFNGSYAEVKDDGVIAVNGGFWMKVNTKGQSAATITVYPAR